jgi:hypothetical protein
MLYREVPKSPALMVGLALLLSLQTAAWSESFPRTMVRTLAGSAFTLPDDLDTCISILMVGFTQKGGSNTKPWAEMLEMDFTRAHGFAVYPVAVLAGVPPLFRDFALNSIRSGVTPLERALSDRRSRRKRLARAGWLPYAG